jgi:hypothetical protein
MQQNISPVVLSEWGINSRMKVLKQVSCQENWKEWNVLYIFTEMSMNFLVTIFSITVPQKASVASQLTGSNSQSTDRIK